MGTAPATLQHMLQRFPPETLRPGDVVITNDPWLGTGHMFDINVMRPIFRDGRLVQGATRGNGDVGEEITANLRTIRSLPLQLRGDAPALADVRGEVVIALTAFDELNRAQEAQDKPPGGQEHPDHRGLEPPL